MALVLSGKKQTLIPPSQEEDDQLLRSAKKIKSGSKFMGKNSYQEQWPKLGTNGQPSFAEKLKGIDRNEDQYDDDNEEEDSAYSDDSMSDNTIQDMEKEKEDPLFKTIEDPVRNFPTFTFSGKMKKRLFRAWRKAVIVKLLDRNIGYKALQTRLQALWAKRGAINLINIGHGFYVVKLSNKEDYFNALTGGPWMIYDHYLTVRPWEPNFRPEKAKIDKVTVWIRIPKMPLEYYDEEALTMIGNRIGETLKVDMNTSCQLRGHYARLCVLVDLEKQLMPGFALDGDEYYMEYEGLHSLCTICGFYGHRKEVCPNKVNQPQEAMDMGKEQINEITKSTSEANTSLRSAEQWKVVQKSRRQRKPKENKGEASRPKNRGSRFGVLAVVTEQGNDAGGEEEVRTEKEQVKGPQAMVQWGNGRQRSNTGKRQGRTIEYS